MALFIWPPYGESPLQGSLKSIKEKGTDPLIHRCEEEDTMDYSSDDTCFEENLAQSLHFLELGIRAYRARVPEGDASFRRDKLFFEIYDKICAHLAEEAQEKYRRFAHGISKYLRV